MDYMDYDLGIDALIDGGGFSAAEAVLLGDGSGGVDLGGFQDMVPSGEMMGPPDELAPDFDFSGGQSGNYNTDTRSNDQLAADLGLNAGDPGLIKSVEAWLKANPNLAKLGLSGVAGLSSAYAANKSGQNSIESLREQEAQKLRTRERVSQSILGMAPFQVNGAQPLQRLDGTRVFGQDGKIMR